MTKNILNISVVTKAIKKLFSFCIFFPEMSRYKRYLNKTKCVYFMIKYEKHFDKYMTVWEKVSNMKKNWWWTYVLKKDSTQKKAFNAYNSNIVWFSL